ncbi:MAG: GHKL domain-containing protein [Bacilli bacterium]|nr:GHKL domain-containing protein [Bacilli bacterium]
MLQIISVWIGIFIMGICEIIFAKIILQEKIKISKIELIAILIISSIAYTLNNLYLYGTIKTLLVCLIHVLVFKYIFKINWSKSIFLTIIYVLLLLIPEIIELFIITEVLHIERDFLYNNYAGSLLSNIFMCIGFVLTTFVLRKLLRKVINTKISSNKKIIILSILTLICIGLFFYTLIKEFRFSNNIIIYLVSIIVLIFVLSSLVRQTIVNYKLTSEYDKLLEFMTTYENEIEKQRILRHETKNEFITIKGKIQDKEKGKEIIDYIDEILKEKIEVKQEEYAKFGYLPPNGIKGLCYLKTQQAQEKKINTSINISKRIKNSNIYKLNIKEQRNLGKILGIILDNAIEASKESKEKLLGIEAYLIKDNCQIIISNSYSKEELNKYNKNKKSSKGKNRGHGLLLLKFIINNSNTFELETNITDKLYTQKIIIKN